MSPFRINSANYSLSHLWQATLAALILTMVSSLSFFIFDLNISFLWLPFLVIVLWPKTASPLPSVILIFLLGLFQDWVTFGVPGQWAFVYLVTYMINQPFKRKKWLDFGHAMQMWVISLLIALSIYIISGRLIFGVWPDWSKIFISPVFVTFLLPIFWYLRKKLQNFLNIRDGGN